MTCLFAEGTPKLVPEEGSTYYHRVQHYRELLDSLQMDAYTHGSILHPEITVDSHIPAYAATCIRSKKHRDALFQSYTRSCVLPSYTYTQIHKDLLCQLLLILDRAHYCVYNSQTFLGTHSTKCWKRLYCNFTPCQSSIKEAVQMFQWCASTAHVLLHLALNLFFHLLRALPKNRDNENTLHLMLWSQSYSEISNAATFII